MCTGLCTGCKITYLIKMLILDLHVSKFASPDHSVLLRSVGFSKLTFRGVVYLDQSYISYLIN